MKKGMVILVIIATCAFVGSYVFVHQGSSDVAEIPVSVENIESPQEHNNEREDLTEKRCVDAGGVWNPCGSACRTNPGDVCIELCVEYCECQKDAQCPSAYSCSEYVEEVGVCL